VVEKLHTMLLRPNSSIRGWRGDVILVANLGKHLSARSFLVFGLCLPLKGIECSFVEKTSFTGKVGSFLNQNPQILMSKATLHRYIKQVREKELSLPSYISRKRGRPLTLESDQEGEILSRLDGLREEFGVLTNSMIVREAIVVTATIREHDTREVAVERVGRCGGEEWLSSFKKHHRLFTFGNKRPMEKERAAKHNLKLSWNIFEICFTSLLCAKFMNVVCLGLLLGGF